MRQTTVCVGLHRSIGYKLHEAASCLANQDTSEEVRLKFTGIPLDRVVRYVFVNLRHFSQGERLLTNLVRSWLQTHLQCHSVFPEPIVILIHVGVKPGWSAIAAVL